MGAQPRRKPHAAQLADPDGPEAWQVNLPWHNRPHMLRNRPRAGRFTHKSSSAGAALAKRHKCGTLGALPRTHSSRSCNVASQLALKASQMHPVASEDSHTASKYGDCHVMRVACGAGMRACIEMQDQQLTAQVHQRCVAC